MILGWFNCSASPLLMPAHRASGIFILGVRGAMIAGLLQYAYVRPIVCRSFDWRLHSVAVYAVSAPSRLEENPLTTTAR
jgi:hypothetical protein